MEKEFKKEFFDTPPTHPPSDEQFDQAVRLACAFIANGDVRLDHGTTEKAIAYDQIAHLVGGLYAALDDARVHVLNHLSESDAPQTS